MHPHALWLGLAGLIPFWSLPLLRGLEWLSPERALEAFTLYSAIILSFLGGVHWYPSVIERARPRQTYIAMGPSILAWLSLLLLPPLWALGPLALGFIGVLLYDFRRLTPPPGYWNLRLILTTVALLCHLWMALPG
ncbi:DUF3429 domain-containing protein [Ferrimonas balearica]|uniref:DUF3429 domain-containing protein n=1 Tax=Ferrimonas balearica TaxID=44012 RepID=UPI001C998A02|nr:DUF3429 domain-containing protein [Ferrimonas balearica]MBY5993339.1 DUF3429 domain-containing protein [Ferrimonas balearica]